MITLILSWFIINQLYIVLKKSKPTVLSCGIFAWAGKNPSTFNSGDFKVLGIFNEARGKHSCGVAFDGDIKVGIDDNKVFKDFISNTEALKPKLFPTVIGHTRHATYGQHTLENAHPFGFGGTKNTPFRFYGCHNGTLVNHKDLAKTFKINPDVWKKGKKNKTQFVRTKIDSEILLEAIYRSKSFKPLAEYNGAAAVVFTDTKKPNVVYCYHGASKLYKEDSNKKTFIERPLYYYKKHKHSLYISSMKESLTAIGGVEDKNVFEFDCNIVYEITDGDIDNAVKHEIDRLNNFTLKSTAYVNKNKVKSYKTYDDLDDEDIYGYIGQGQQVLDLNKPTTCSFPDNLGNSKVNKDLNIYNETVDYKENEVYFNKFRYKRNSKRIHGIYIYKKDIGFHYLGETMGEAIDNFKSKVVGKWFCFIENNFITEKKALSSNTCFVPYKITMYNISRFFPFFYFIDGIRLKTAVDYVAVYNRYLKGTKINYEQLSVVSAHPIIELDSTIGFKPTTSQKIILDKHVVTDTICPLGSKWVYQIEKGNLINRWAAKTEEDNDEKEDVKVINISDNKKERIEKLDEVFNEIEDYNNSFLPPDDESHELLEERINEIFTETYAQFHEDIKQLEKFKNIDKAQIAIGILEEFVNESKLLIELEPKE